MSLECTWNQKIEPQNKEKWVSCRRPQNNRCNVFSEDEFRMIFPVKEEHKLMFRVILNKPLTDFIGVPAEAFHFSMDEKASIDTDPCQNQKLCM